MEAKYLIYSMENQCVFTVAHNPVTANAIAESNVNAVVLPITPHNFDDYALIRDRDFFKDNIYKVYTRVRKFTKADPSTISQSWKDERIAMQYCQNGHLSLDIHYLFAITPVERSFQVGFSNEVWQELMLCDPGIDMYSRCIEEYARIANKSPNQVYKEFLLKIEGEKFVRFRIAALVDRWRLNINKIKTKEDLNKVKEGMMAEFWLKSSI
jgi:hypothetical protein